MRRLNIANPLRSRVLGQVDVDDDQIRRTIKLRIMRSADANAISRVAQPFLQQSTREVVFLVYHDVQLFQSCTCQPSGSRAAYVSLVSAATEAILQSALRAVMSAGYRLVSDETSL